MKIRSDPRKSTHLVAHCDKPDSKNFFGIDPTSLILSPIAPVDLISCLLGMRIMYCLHVCSVSVRDNIYCINAQAVDFTSLYIDSIVTCLLCFFPSLVLPQDREVMMMREGI